MSRTATLLYTVSAPVICIDVKSDARSIMTCLMLSSAFVDAHVRKVKTTVCSARFTRISDNVTKQLLNRLTVFSARPLNDKTNGEQHIKRVSDCVHGAGGNTRPQPVSANQGKKHCCELAPPTTTHLAPSGVIQEILAIY